MRRFHDIVLRLAMLAPPAFLMSAPGCGQRPILVPVAGRVTLDGKPLEFGSVMIQPTAGPAARGSIGTDGRFTVGTFARGDGAIAGPATVRVACFEQSRAGGQPPTGELTLGMSLIPEKYTQFHTSGITTTVVAGMGPVEIALTSK